MTAEDGMSLWKQLSDELSDRVEQARAHLVGIQAGRHRGTGIAWEADKVVTAAHLVSRRETVEVVVAGEVHPGRVLGLDPGTDLAVIAVDGVTLSPAIWAPTSEARVGELVLAVGHAGPRPRATLGALCAARGEWVTPDGAQVERRLEVDGSLPRGGSGGPLVGASGWLGMNTANLVPGGATIPVETLRRVVPLLASGKVGEPGYLGLSTIPVAVPAELAAVAGQEGGVLVVGVQPGGPGARAGVLQGDLILGLDGVALGTVRDVVAAVRGKAGQEVSLRLVRAGGVQEVTVTLGERPRRGGC